MGKIIRNERRLMVGYDNVPEAEEDIKLMREDGWGIVSTEEYYSNYRLVITYFKKL